MSLIQGHITTRPLRCQLFFGEKNGAFPQENAPFYFLFTIKGVVKIPHGFAALRVVDVDNVDFLESQAHGKVLGLVNIIGLKKRDKLGAGQIAAPHDLKAHSSSSKVFFSVYPSVRVIATLPFCLW